MKPINVRDFNNSCHGKARHRDRESAVIARKRGQKDWEDLGLTVYLCRHCNGWHVGHARGSTRRKLQTQRLIDLIDKAVRSDRRASA